MSKKQPAPTTTPAAHYDAITLALERVDALSSVLEAHLTRMGDGTDHAADHGNELYGLSVLVGDIRDKHQIIREHAEQLLNCVPRRQPKTVGAR